MPASQALYFDALNPSSSSNTLTPYVNFEPPTISAHQPEACVSVGIGPMVDLTLEVMAPKLGKKGTKFEVVTQIGVEVPKVETCFTDARNVDGQCRVGNIPQAVKEKTTVGLGLKFEVWFKAAKEGFIVLQSPVHKFDLDSLLDGLLHRTWDVSHHCFDIKKIGRALGFGSGGAPERSPVPPQQGPLPSPPPRTNPNGPVNGPITIPGSGPRVLNPPGVYRPLDPKQGSPSPIIPGTNPPLQPNYRAVPIQPGNSQPPPQVPPIRGTVRPPVRNTPTSPHEIPLDGTPYQVYHNDQSMSGARQNVPDPTRGRRVKKRPRFSIGAARLIS
ncbi:MAG: hypothetical protein M1823_002727 [Watsoniomyces obsoletus]|nr:MAG: hypothetical protein M1823_002727 [Watsoniomyces obsoletus]